MTSVKSISLKPLFTAACVLSILTACGGGGGAGGSDGGGFTPGNTNKPTISSEASLSSAPAKSSQASAASSSSKAGPIIDTTAPSKPGNFKPQSVRYDIVILSWNPSSDNGSVVFYNVYRDGILLDQLESSENTYYDYDVSPGRSYTYSITAGDAADNWSSLISIDITTPSSSGGNASSVASKASSAASNSSTPSSTLSSKASSSLSSSSTSSKSSSADTVKPTAPTDVTKVRSTTSQVDISWTAAVDDIGVTEYKIYRDGTLLKSVAPNVLSYSDKTVSADITYWYGVSAGDAAGNWSAQKLVSIKTPSLTAPNSVTLQWQAPTQRENGSFLSASELGGYKVRYKQAKDSSYSYLTVGKNDSQLVIANLIGDYSFEISAFDTNERYSYFVDIEPQ